MVRRWKKQTFVTTVWMHRLKKGRGDKVALLFQGEPEADCKRFTYNDLLKHVCRFANALKKNGVKKGDRIVLYLPMIWQLPVVMLACARIGAVHTVVFGGFSAEALADRMLACGAKRWLPQTATGVQDKRLMQKQMLIRHVCYVQMQVLPSTMYSL